jgi:hypothetical protein
MAVFLDAGGMSLAFKRGPNRRDVADHRMGATLLLFASRTWMTCMNFSSILENNATEVSKQTTSSIHLLFSR